MDIIQCKDVSKSFGEKVALDHVSVDIPKVFFFFKQKTAYEVTR